jgi:4-hydroxy-tetrahydrodipicolinate synthase
MAGYTKAEAQDWALEHIRGQWTTLITPFTADDRLDEQGLRANVRHVRSLGTSGAGCTWGMGEFWSLTLEERIRVYDVVSDEAAGEWPIAAHVTHTSLGDMLALADRAEADGFDLLIVAPPYIVTRTEAQVIEWVRRLADHTPMAIMFYNSPQFGIVMSAEGLKSLCEIPNVVGVKEASFDRQLSIDTHTSIGDDYVISTPDEWALFTGREMGFRQQVMFANTSDWRFDTPDENYYVQFIDRATSGDIDDGLYDRHIRPIKEMSDRWWQQTVKRSGGALPASLCKYWGELMGMAGGHVRPPLFDLSQDDKDVLKAAIAAVRDGALAAAGESR